MNNDLVNLISSLGAGWRRRCWRPGCSLKNPSNLRLRPLSFLLRQRQRQPRQLTNPRPGHFGTWRRELPPPRCPRARSTNSDRARSRRPPARGDTSSRPGRSGHLIDNVGLALRRINRHQMDGHAVALGRGLRRPPIDRDQKFVGRRPFRLRPTMRMRSPDRSRPAGVTEASAARLASVTMGAGLISTIPGAAVAR